MALASYVARLREVLQAGPSHADEQAFGGGFMSLTPPSGADGVVLFPDYQSGFIGAMTLRGNVGDVGLALSKVSPSIICTTDTVVLHCLGDGIVAARWFRFQ